MPTIRLVAMKVMAMSVVRVSGNALIPLALVQAQKKNKTQKHALFGLTAKVVSTGMRVVDVSTCSPN